MSESKVSTVRVISRASLAQRARREREGFSKRARDEEDSSIGVISKAALAQRARREREGFVKHARLEQDSSISVISKASLAQRARREREGFVKHAQLEQDTIAQEEVMDKEKRQTKGKGMTMPTDKENIDPVVQLLRRNNVGVVIREARDFDPIHIHMEQEKGKDKTKTKGKGKAIAVDTENIDSMAQLLHKDSVGVVIRETRDFNPICILQEQERDKEEPQTKGKGKAIAVDAENIDPIVGTSCKQSSNHNIHVTIFGKHDRHVKHVIQLLRKENILVHLQTERDYNSIRIREEKMSRHNEIQLSNRKDNKFSEATRIVVGYHVHWY